MVRDDYFLLVYKLLKILYTILKSGKAITNDELKDLSEGIPSDYWKYILKTLNEEGYINGIVEVDTLIGNSIKIINLQITPPKGIEYLQDNSKKMQKSAEFVKNLPQWISLIAKFA